MFESEWDAGLDDAQLAAVTHGGGPLVIVAGAGTGKTRTLTARVAQLLAHGADPARVLLLTFTRRAADDMLARAAILCGDRRVTATAVGRHVPCGRAPADHPALRSARPGAGVVGPRPGRRRRPDGPAAPRPRPGRHSGTVPARGHPGRRLLPGGQHRPPGPRGDRGRVPVVRPAHRKDPRPVPRLRRPQTGRQSLLDFDDLLLAWRSLLADPALGPMVAGRWDHVLVDEYQDVNQVQVDIVRRLCPAGTGLTVVGDDAQAIYGFRGADPAHLRRPGQHPAGRDDPAAGTQLPLPATAAGPGQRGPADHQGRPTSCGCIPIGGTDPSPGWSAAMTRRPKPAGSPRRSWRTSRTACGCGTRPC